MAGSVDGKSRLIAPRILAFVLTIVGLVLLVGGAKLLSLGGSPYYAATGLLLLGSAIAFWRGSRWGAWLYLAMLAITAVWALWEVGLDGWALMPRLVGPLVIGLWVILPFNWRRMDSASLRTFGGRLAGLLVVAVVLALAFGALRGQPARATAAAPAVPAAASAPAAADGQDEWRAVGASLGGSRFLRAATQITPQNVIGLEKAWDADLGLPGDGLYRFENTPIQVGATLYACTPVSEVLALDADTGKVKWRFDPHLQLKGYHSKTCRSVSYWKSPTPLPECTSRILASTVDARLMALDAETGQLCKSFGENGFANLLEGMGKVKVNFAYSSSGPLVAGGVAVLGGWIADGQETGEPSGVIRAFDVVTGKLAWAFDAGREDRRTLPPAGETYTRGTPNAWGLFSADENLGMLYVGTGNAPPDYWGGERRPFDEKFASSVVALDIKTGAVRWTFQTVHHDVWDYDVGAQPVLVNLNGPSGPIPALLQPTKRGQIFTLDRRTGAPIDPVVERPVPQGASMGDRLSPTQPYPTRMPPFTDTPLTEAKMWGITPIDQMLCRIEFKKLRYDGQFTPPSVQGGLEYPGYIGGVNWGSVSVDEDNHVMIVNSSRMANRVQLIPRAEADRRGWKAADENGKFSIPMGAGAPQMGTPFAVTNEPFMSPLGVPCQQPPYAMISAVDLNTFTLKWTRPLGSARAAGPLGIASGLPYTLGAPMIAGTMVTPTGLAFFAGSQDALVRAIDVQTGKELWTSPIGLGSTATPMTFVSPATGRQYVLVAIGAAVGSHKPTGLHFVAFALPAKKATQH